MDPYEPPAFQGDDSQAEPRKSVFGDVELVSEVAGLGMLRTLVRTRSGHGFVWIDGRLLGRWWSLNPICDQVEFALGATRVRIRYDWLPVFAATVSRDGRPLGRFRYRRETLVYWGIQAVALAVTAGVVAGIAIWYRFR